MIFIIILKIFNNIALTFYFPNKLTFADKFLKLHYVTYKINIRNPGNHRRKNQ